MRSSSWAGSLPSIPGTVARLALCLLAALVSPSVLAAALDVGVSSVRSQHFGHDSVAGFLAERDDRFAEALAVGDFNGDGADDLATGVPGDNGISDAELANCGAVILRFGIPGSGLIPGVDDFFLNQLFPGAPDPAEAGDEFGAALTACDFDNDGFDDLAVGIPLEDVVAGEIDAGAVDIFYGSFGGPPPTAGQHWTQNSAGVPGDAGEIHHFGASLACGDFDADGFADLAVGIPGQDATGSGLHAGAVEILYGSATGLGSARSALFEQNSPGVDGTGEGLDFFGSALATGDFNGDGFDDLAVGVPGEDNPGVGVPGADLQGRGAVAVLFGSGVGIAAAGNLVRTESELGGTSELGDRLGSALAAGDFDGDGFADLAVGISGEDLSGPLQVDSGQLVAIYGAASGFAFARTQFWTEDGALGAGESEPTDRFGFALVTGDFDADGRDDLAIGHPGEYDVVAGDGAVTVMSGSANGLSAARLRSFASGQAGVPGLPNLPERRLGHALASGDFDGDGFADLVAGAPREDQEEIVNVGAEIVLYGALFADGFDGSTSGFWTPTGE
ncbi:MAG: FG-GAP repeat protein [Thermoanaerobaculia bacterium]